MRLKVIDADRCTKQIDWSYASSENALRMGFANVGCWTVSVAIDNNPANAIAGFGEESDAVEFAKQLPIEFGYLWKKKYE